MAISDDSKTLDNPTNDSFSKPANLQTTPRQGEWDQADPKNANPPESLEDKEQREIWAEDPDAEANRDFDIDEEEPSEIETKPEDTPETDEEPEAEDVDAVEEPEEPEVPQNASPRAQQRIRDEISRRKEAEERAIRTEERLAALVEAQERRARLEEQDYLARRQASHQQNQQLQQEQMIQRMQSMGMKFDPEDAASWFALEAFQKADAAQQRAEAAERQLMQREAIQQQQMQQRQYLDKLGESLDASLNGVVVSKEQRVALYENAIAIAQVKQCQPDEAVKAVLSPVLASLKANKPKGPTKRSQPNADGRPTADDVISTTARASGRKAGERASGKKEMAKDVKAFLR